MKDVLYLLFQLLTTLAKLLRPGGGRTVIAENLILKQQLIIHSRSRQRAPNLSTQDRALLGFWSLFLNPRRIAISASIIKPSTLLRFHNALKKQKYRQLYSPSGGRKPGPKGPSKEAINAIVEMKRRNPRVLDIDEIKSLPHVPMSHLFVERLIGSTRRELRGQTLFWTATDLEKKLRDYQRYYNECRTHSVRDGATPIETTGNKVTDLNKYRWETHCRGLFELPIAA